MQLVSCPKCHETTPEPCVRCRNCKYRFEPVSRQALVTVVCAVLAIVVLATVAYRAESNRAAKVATPSIKPSGLTSPPQPAPNPLAYGSPAAEMGPSPSPSVSASTSPTPEGDDPVAHLLESTAEEQPSPSSRPQEIHFADVVEYPGWEKAFDTKGFIYFHKLPEKAYGNWARLWIKAVVKSPPERVRRELIASLRGGGTSSAGYERYTETLEYLTFNCQGKSYRRLSSVDYDDFGRKLGELGEEYRDSYVIPDSVGDALFDIACKPAGDAVTAATPAPWPTYAATPLRSASKPSEEPLSGTSTYSPPAYTPPAYDPPRTIYSPPVAENGSYYGESSPATGRRKTVHVEGYYRRDGTYVRGHYRSTPRRRD
jgi:hypothetical protein